MRNWVCGVVVIIALVVRGHSFAADGLQVVCKKRVEDQQEVQRVLSRSEAPKTGVVVEDPYDKGRKVLRIRGRDVCSASDFEPTYSESTNGLIAFVLYPSNAPPSYLADVDEEGRVNMRIGELWVTRGGAPPLRASPTTTQARNPCVSPDGRYVAFTASEVDTNGFPGKESVYLTDLSDTQIPPLVLATSLDGDGAACPLTWDGSRMLTVFVSDGPDGSKSRIESFRVVDGVDR